MMLPSMKLITGTVFVMCLALFGGCAHVVVPHASEPSAETQPSGRNPVIIAMPPIPSDEPKVIIHKPGVDLSTPDIWVGVLLALLFFVAK